LHQELITLGQKPWVISNTADAIWNFGCGFQDQVILIAIATSMPLPSE